MINEVRARVVDVETGETPRALRALEPEAPAPVAKPRRAREAACPPPTPEPAPFVASVAKTAPEALPRAEVLWAEEPSSGSDRAWTRGLRG